jgi:molybdate-binding protein
VSASKPRRLRFGLHFIPLVRENYFLACLSCNVGHPAIQRLRGVLQAHAPGGKFGASTGLPAGGRAPVASS